MFKVLTPFPGTPLFKHMKPLITETDWEKFDGYTPTFQHPNMTNAELKHLLGSAYVRFYIRPTFAMNYLGIKKAGERLGLGDSARTISNRAGAWRPWRTYATQQTRSNVMERGSCRGGFQTRPRAADAN